MQSTRTRTRWTLAGAVAVGALALVASSPWSGGHSAARGMARATWDEELAPVSLALTPAAAKSLAGGVPDRPRVGGTYTRNYGSDPGSLNNLLRRDYYQNLICREYLFPPLLLIDGDLELVPTAAASRAEILDGGRTLRWTLRAGLTWDEPLEDGTFLPVTTADVDYSWRMLRDPEVPAQSARGYLERFTALRVLDERTFEVDVDRPYFRAEVDFGTEFRLMPERWAGRTAADFNEDPLGRTPIGYGPYRLESWEPDKQLTLVRRADYWTDGPRPFWMERMRFLVVRNKEQHLPLFLQGELSLCTEDDPERWERIQEDPAVREAATFHEYYLARLNFVGWNNAHWAFQDPRVRRAMTLLCPRQLIADQFYRGKAIVPSGPWPLTCPEYDASVAPLPYDPAAALELLREAGFADTDGDGILDRGGRAFRFKLTYQANLPGHLHAGIVRYQDALRGAGVVADLDPIGLRELLGKADARQLESFVLGWSLDAIDCDLYPNFHSSQAGEGMNYVQLEDAEMDQLLGAYRDETDPAARREVAHAIHRRFQELQPFTLLPTPKSLVLVSTRCRNVHIGKRGALPDDWWLAD